MKLTKINMSVVSIIIPTLNSANVLDKCLRSIRNQNYPQNNIEIILVDGGSVDKTLQIANKYQTIIIKNPLKTAESAKAIGVKISKGEFIALIDSDNILPENEWLNKMLKPLLDNNKLIGSEPWAYTYRPKAGFIERYSSLTGVNDPYTLLAKNYDRISYLHPSWTALNLDIVDSKNYQITTLKFNQPIPTIGANGTIFRAKFIKKFSGKYFFDIDIISSLMKPNRNIQFAKVKIGIIHTFCESSIHKFYRKQYRRATDLYTYQSDRSYYLTKNNLKPTLKWILYVIFIFPMLFDTIRGYIKKPDPAWFFHPIACIITSYCYGISTIKNKLGYLKPLNRDKWHQ